MKYLPAVLFAPFFVFAESMTKINCNYSFMGFAMSTSQLNLHEDQTPEPSVLVSMGPGTAPSKFTVTPEVVADNEMVHLWISKEVKDGAIEMITYKVAQEDGTQGKLINHNVPMGQEIAGPCTFTPFESPQ